MDSLNFPLNNLSEVQLSKTRYTVAEVTPAAAVAAAKSSS